MFPLRAQLKSDCDKVLSPPSKVFALLDLICRKSPDWRGSVPLIILPLLLLSTPSTFNLNPERSSHFDTPWAANLKTLNISYICAFVI